MDVKQQEHRKENVENMAEQYDDRGATDRKQQGLNHMSSIASLLLGMPEQNRYSQSGPEVSGSYFLERDYRPLLLGGTRPPGLNSSVTQPTRCRKQVNRHSSDICRWVTVHNLLPGSAASN